MVELTNEEFIKFMEFYRDKTYEDEYNQIHKCYDSITELSRSDTYQADSLIINSQEMYGLDWIVKSSKKLSKKPPKSTDALFFREDENGRLSLHIIEFKFIGRKSHWDKMNSLWSDIRSKIPCDDCDIEEEEECFDDFFIKDFKLIKKDFIDPIEVSLQLKPYEVIFITLPLLYEEYCNEKPDVIKKDINSYLNNIDKYYWAFVGNFSQSYYNIKSKADKLNKYSNRLEMTIFKKVKVKPSQDFKKVLNREIFGNFDF